MFINVCYLLAHHRCFYVGLSETRKEEARLNMPFTKSLFLAALLVSSSSFAIDDGDNGGGSKLRSGRGSVDRDLQETCYGTCVPPSNDLGWPCQQANGVCSQFMGNGACSPNTAECGSNCINTLWGKKRDAGCPPNKPVCSRSPTEQPGLNIYGTKCRVCIDNKPDPAQKDAGCTKAKPSCVDNKCVPAPPPNLCGSLLSNPDVTFTVIVNDRDTYTATGQPGSDPFSLVIDDGVDTRFDPSFTDTSIELGFSTDFPTNTWFFSNTIVSFLIPSCQSLPSSVTLTETVADSTLSSSDLTAAVDAAGVTVTLEFNSFFMNGEMIQIDMVY